MASQLVLVRFELHQAEAQHSAACSRWLPDHFTNITQLSSADQLIMSDPTAFRLDPCSTQHGGYSDDGGVLHYCHLSSRSQEVQELAHFRLEFRTQMLEASQRQILRDSWQLFTFVPGMPGELMIVQQNSRRILYATMPRELDASTDIFEFGSHQGKDMSARISQCAFFFFHGRRHVAFADKTRPANTYGLCRSTNHITHKQWQHCCERMFRWLHQGLEDAGWSARRCKVRTTQHQHYSTGICWATAGTKALKCKQTSSNPSNRNAAAFPLQHSTSHVQTGQTPLLH